MSSLALGIIIGPGDFLAGMEVLEDERLVGRCRSWLRLKSYTRMEGGEVTRGDSIFEVSEWIATALMS